MIGGDATGGRARPQADHPDAPPRSVRADLMRVAGLILPAWRSWLLILACVLVTSLLGLATPFFVRQVIDLHLPQANVAGLSLAAAGMVLAPALSGLLGVWQGQRVTELAQQTVFELRTRMYEQLSLQSLRFFSSTRGGEIQSRLQSDVAAVQQVLAGLLVTQTANLLTLVVTVVAIFQIDLRLALLSVSILPLLIFPTVRVSRRSRELAARKQEQLADMSAHVQETMSVQGFLLARLAGAHGAERDRFRQKVGQVRDTHIRQQLLGRWFFMAMGSMATIGPALIYLAGGYLVIRRELTVGAVVAVVMYLGRLYGPVAVLANAHVTLMTSLASFGRIFDYLDLPPEVADPPSPLKLPSVRGQLRFDNVSARYTDDRWAVRDIDLAVEPGQMVALVGPSGAGKTTLTYLACRLLDPNIGRVCLDGHDLREFSLADLSRWVAKVSQEPTLFHASILENVAYGRPGATRADIVSACRAAQIHDAIAALPDGYDTVVGERGYRLSGGEKQRVALARVFLMDPRVLILDEATSALDAHSETAVQASMAPLVASRTTLVVAHRLSTVLRADTIVVMDRGSIVERGPHAALVAAGGLYSSLFQTQFRGAVDASGSR